MMLGPYKEPLTGVMYYPHHWSTYCQHDRHGDCRLTCKHCPERCRCPCHQKATGPGTPEWAAECDEFGSHDDEFTGGPV